MKAAVVNSMGERPVYGEFDDPTAMDGHCLINVTASALSHVTRARAA